MINERQYRFLVAWDKSLPPFCNELSFLVKVGYLKDGQITPSGRAAMREYEEDVCNA